MWQIVSGETAMKWDIMDIYLPWKYFITEAINNRNLPLWNPYMNSGFSQMGDPGTWYPVSWLIGFVFRYNITAVHFEYLLHLYVAGIGIYKLGELKKFSRITCLIIATSYMFSGFFISNAQHIGWLISAAWLPYTVYYFIKLQTNLSISNAVKLSFVLFLMLSGGYPGIFISTIYLLAGYFICYFVGALQKRQFRVLKKQILYLSISATVFLTFSAVILFSSFDLAQHITRAQGLKYNNEAWGILTGSLQPKALLSFIYPFALGKNDVAFWGADFSLLNCYFGLGSLLLLIFINTVRNIPKEIRIYSVIGLLFLLLSMAEIFPFRKWLLFLPYMDLFRFSTFFRLFSIFFFLIATGFALEKIFSDYQIRAKFFYYLLGFSITLFAINVILLFNIEKWKFNTIFTDGWIHFLEIAGINERIFLQAWIAMGLLLVIAFFIRQKRIPGIKFSYVIFLVFCLDMILATQLNIYATVITDFPVKKINNSFKSFPTDYPIPSLTTNSSCFNDKELKSTIPYLWKNLSIYHKQPSCDGNSPYGFQNMRDAIQNGTYNTLINNPFLFFASGITEEKIVDTNSIDSNSFQKLRITDFCINEFELISTTNKPQYLVCLQNYYPYWEVFVDHKKQEILKVNDTFMAVKIKRGKHHIRFRFYPEKIIYSAYISIASWICFILFIAFISYRTKKNKTAFIISSISFIILLMILGFRNKPIGNTEIYEKMNAQIEQELNLPGDSISIILNIDKPSEITKNDPNIYLINIDVKLDIAKIISKLEKLDNEYILYYHANKVQYPLVDYIIEDHYPNITKVENFGNPYYILANKFQADGKYAIESCNEFENGVPKWSLNKNAIDSTTSYSGINSFMLDTNTIYSSTYRSKYSEFIYPPQKAILVSALVRSETKINPFMVFQIDRDGKTVVWQVEHFNAFYNPNKEWYKVYLLIEIDNENIKPDDIISVYVWNINKNTFWIDEFTIKTY